MGDVQEEESEGVAVVGPSGEAALHSSGSTLPAIIFSRILCQNILRNNLFFFFNLSVPSFTFLFS